jgi:hypothetical protein
MVNVFPIVHLEAFIRIILENLDGFAAAVVFSFYLDAFVS